MSTGESRSGQARSKILIIEDDKKLCNALVEGFRSEGYEVKSTSTAEEGFFLIHSEHPDLLILDLSLPFRNGLDILRQIRSEGVDVRVIILTSHNTVGDRVQGLHSGADDYLGKPFSFPELSARVQALLRRILAPVTSDILRISDLMLNTRVRTASRGQVQLELTGREFDLLLYLAENRGRTVSREMLAKDVWKESSRYTPLDNVIDVQIARLRRKIDDSFPIKLLQTIRGMGFMLMDPEA